MTKKHFRAIARTLHEIRERERTAYRSGALADASDAVDLVDEIARELCPTFYQLNSNFRSTTFVDAVRNGL